MHRLPAIVFALVIGFGGGVLPAQAQGELLGRINSLRQSLGLAAYTTHGALAAAAQNHAQWMIANPGVISHVQDNGSRPRDRAASAGYNSPWVSENIYLGGPASSLEDAWSFWMNSAIHYQQITNARYQHIGIATQSDGFYTAYVLVFGAPEAVAAGASGGTTGASSGSGGGASAAPAPPSFIVGVDNAGNIMHEVQEGDTLGDIALLYGYTWEDIPAMLALNGLTQEDIRLMQVGSVFLVPPQSGTYTPTPAQQSPTPTPEPGVADDAAQASSIVQGQAAAVDPAMLGILPTLPLTTTEATPATTGTSLPAPAVSAITSTPRPTQAVPTPTPVPPTQPTLWTRVAVAASPSATATPDPIIQSDAPATASDEGLPAWLIVGILAQVGVLIAAILEYVRRLWQR